MLREAAADQHQKAKSSHATNAFLFSEATFRTRQDELRARGPAVPVDKTIQEAEVEVTTP